VSGSSLTAENMMLSYICTPESASWLDIAMIRKIKQDYVDSRHTHAITRLSSANKYRDGHYRTHIYVNGKRKKVERSTKEEIYDFLFEFYQQPKTYDDVFKELVEYKRECALSPNSINDLMRYHGYINTNLRSKPITHLTEDDIRSWLMKEYLLRKPKKEALKKMLQLIRSVFDFGIRHRYCLDNPARYILLEDYSKACDVNTKSNEDHSFSDEDIQRLREYCLEHLSNPHSIVMLVAMETGMRAGELAALHKSDVGQDHIHIHRQQIRNPKEGPNSKSSFTEVSYTKNERKNPKGGRYFPITPRCREAIDLALALPGESEYLFHHPNGNPIQKDSYGYYLRRVCGRLNISVKHNHAFRVHVNARLIAAGIDANGRCLLLGHSMQTNERHYSFADSRKLDEIKAILSDAS